MNVLLINGSPHANGNTALALKDIFCTRRDGEDPSYRQQTRAGLFSLSPLRRYRKMRYR